MTLEIDDEMYGNYSKLVHALSCYIFGSASSQLGSALCDLASVSALASCTYGFVNRPIPAYLQTNGGTH